MMILKRTIVETREQTCHVCGSNTITIQCRACGGSGVVLRKTIREETIVASKRNDCDLPAL